MSIEGYQSRIKCGNKLLDTISCLFSNLTGINKLKNKIKQEIAFLTKSQESGILKKEHISCSNLHHYESLIEYLKDCKDCSSVLEVFQYIDPLGAKKRLTVDVVSCNKTVWTKVIARNPKALSLISKGDGEYGQKSVLEQAIEYVRCAEQNLSFYSPPQVTFFFACGIEEHLANLLQQSGINVEGYLVKANENVLNLQAVKLPSSTDQIQEALLCTKLNLDISTMLAYVSALTNGHSHVRLKGHVLTDQARRERENPVKPFLEQIFAGKSLYCCEKAMTSFKNILHTLGGEGEKRRGTDLISRITVVEDSYCENLKPGGQVKERSLAIFGTGLALKAVTVTANAGFVRAAANQGIVLPVIIHESRALTEQKEILDPNNFQDDS